MSGVRLWAEEILRIEWRCSSVRRVLCEVLFIFIKENSCSHKYVLPNIESVWAAWEHRWGIVSGMKRGNSAAPTDSYFAFSVSLHWSSISSICRFDGALSTSAANGLLRSSNLLFGASKSSNRRMKSAPSMSSFSVNCLVGKTAAATFFHCLAVREMAQVFLKILRLQQAQLGFTSPHCSVHVSNDTAPPLKLQV